MIDLIIGDIPIPLLASIRMAQDYEVISATTEYRMGDGGFDSQTSWGGNRKLRTTITGSGQIPLGLSGLVLPQKNLVVACFKPRAITSLSNVITLPAARRTDPGADPFGLALMDDKWRKVAVDLIGNVATLEEVSAAKQYQVHYYPKITANVRAPVERKDARGNAYSWSLSAEEM